MDSEDVTLGCRLDLVRQANHTLTGQLRILKMEEEATEESGEEEDRGVASSDSTGVSSGEGQDTEGSEGGEGVSIQGASDQSARPSSQLRPLVSHRISLADTRSEGSASSPAGRDDAGTAGSGLPPAEAASEQTALASEHSTRAVDGPEAGSSYILNQEVEGEQFSRVGEGQPGAAPTSSSRSGSSSQQALSAELNVLADGIVALSIDASARDSRSIVETSGNDAGNAAHPSDSTPAGAPTPVDNGSSPSEATGSSTGGQLTSQTLPSLEHMLLHGEECSMYRVAGTWQASGRLHITASRARLTLSGCLYKGRCGGLWQLHCCGGRLLDGPLSMRLQ